METIMRSAVVALVVLTAPAALAAQGWIVPRPCRPVPLGCTPTVPQLVERAASDVRATLDGRVVHYEVDETFVNRGGLVGEADYMFPLPADAAFQDLKLSIDGELVSGETMGADEARRIYEETV